MSHVTITKFEEELHRKDTKSPAYLESMLTRLNRKLQGGGLFKDLKRVEFYEKPSDERRRKKHEALLRMRREQKDALHRKRKKRKARPANKRADKGNTKRSV